MSKNKLIALITIAVVVATAFAFNPSPDKHREKIRETIAERNQLAGMLGLGAFTAFASTYHQLGVASYTTVNGRTTSVGAFGMVFVMNQSKGE